MVKNRYRNWKGEGIKEAEAIYKELHSKLGRPPTKSDFIEHGYYGAWMARYRHQKKQLKEAFQDMPSEHASLDSLLAGDFVAIRKLVANSSDRQKILLIMKDCYGRLLSMDGRSAEKSILQIIKKR